MVVMMQQRKRREKTNGLGYYTYWDKSRDNGCIYCGDLATTREHVPSKAFLVEPYPENLPTIPSCFKCNNGFSFDEQYVSYYLDTLRNYIYAEYQCAENITNVRGNNYVPEQLINTQIKNY